MTERRANVKFGRAGLYDSGVAMTSVFQRDYAVIPPCIVKGDGVFLYDDTGRQYLDAMGSAGVVGIGHGRTEVTRALADAGQSVSFV